MTILDYVVNVSLSIVLIVGGYQFYFWCQRHPFTKPRLFRFALDNRVQRRPAWIWIYSGLYYPVIVLTAVSARSMSHFNYMAFSYLLLLVMQMAFFSFFPVVLPEDWRTNSVPALTFSEKFLELVQRLDGRSNCFPSMHVSAATLTAFHLSANASLGIWPFVFPLLISISAVFTRQHYIVDIPAGAALGWFAYEIAPHCLA